MKLNLRIDTLIQISIMLTTLFSIVIIMIIQINIINNYFAIKIF